jgi:hypothetical protein
MRQARLIPKQRGNATLVDVYRARATVAPSLRSMEYRETINFPAACTRANVASVHHVHRSYVRDDYCDATKLSIIREKKHHGRGE